MKTSSMPSKTYPHPEGAQRARLEGRETVLQPFVPILAQPLRCFPYQRRPRLASERQRFLKVPGWSARSLETARTLPASSSPARLAYFLNSARVRTHHQAHPRWLQADVYFTG